MADVNGDDERSRAATGPGAAAGTRKPALEPLSQAECWELICPGGVGRIGFSGRFGPMILPVNYKIYEKSVVFRTAQDSPMGEDLRTGIAHAEYKVAFEIDHYDEPARNGWSVLIQGDVYHVESGPEREALRQTGVEAWVAGERDLFLRIVPTRVTGRRVGELPA